MLLPITTTYFNHLKIEDTMHIFNEMIEKGVHPNEVTYDIIIHVDCLRLGVVKMQISYSKELIAKDFSRSRHL